MVIAYKKIKEIEKLNNIIEKHRTWLLDYEGKKYSKAFDGCELIKWKNTKYSDKIFQVDINKVGELGNRLRIEFDDHNSEGNKDKEKIKKNVEFINKKLKELGFGFIRSTHNGLSDYHWVEFTEDLSTEEKKNFLKWISPEGSEVDINFSSSNFCFPVLYAVHWKHSYHREMPVEYFEGEQINYKSLNIKKINGRKKTERTKNGFNYNTFKIFGYKGQGEFFNELQPIFYDKNSNFWLWNEKNKYWEITDEVDLLNLIESSTNEDIISSKRRTELINTLKQEGRKHIPENIKPTWIQFKEQIIDLETGERFKAESKFFVTNPISYNISGNTETPVMDKIFEEWVGNEYKNTLYEIIAYCLLPSYPIHRLFCFIGIGMNGKTCYLNLLKKFIGKMNITSIELDILLNSRFEVTKLYKKLACIMGETNFNQLSKTSIIKKLTGGDTIGFEYKNKTPFDDYNYAKILIATNNLPETDDKTIGFYRRWLIIDFPNQFSESKDILSSIPEEEYENLATKCVFILSELIKSRKFSNEGDIEERMKKFEDKSNPLLKFIKENTENNINEHITTADFNKKFNEWCKTNRFRQVDERTIGKILKVNGYERSRKYVDWLFNGKGGQIYVYFGLKWKN